MRSRICPRLMSSRPGSLGLTQGAESEALFTSGTAGMLLDGDWIVGSVLEGKSGAKFSWGWSLFPPAPGPPRRTRFLSTRAAPWVSLPELRTRLWRQSTCSRRVAVGSAV